MCSIPLESLTEKQTKDGADYILNHRSPTWKAQKKTTDQAGAEISWNKEENTKTVQKEMVYFEDSKLSKTVLCLTTLVNGNPSIHMRKTEL